MSIFEVDPEAIPTGAAAAAAEQPAAAARVRLRRGGWPGMELEAQPKQDLLEESAVQAPPAPIVQPASLSWRLLAPVVDGALIAVAFLAAAALAAITAGQLPGPRTVELGAALAMLALAAAYQMLFFTLGRATPGMKYAGIELSTFDGLCPTRAQRWRRLMAQLLSLVPLGLGFAWALFDDAHLTWHDRLSKTYLRKR